MSLAQNPPLFCTELLISRPSVCMGTGSLFVYGFRRFRGKARPLRRKTVFAIASIGLNQGSVVRVVAKEMPVTPAEVTSDFYSVYYG